MRAVSTADEVMVVLFFLAFVPALGYTAFYMFRPWRSTPQGRALMVKSWGNVFLLGLGFATLTLGRDFPFRDTIRLTGMSIFVVGYWMLLHSLLTSPGAETFPPRRWFRRRKSAKP